jgi:hypothetical protein
VRCSRSILFYSVPPRYIIDIEIILANTTRHCSPRERAFLYLRPLVCSLRHGMMHMVVFFFWRFDGVCGGRQGWAGRGGLGGFSYDKTTGQNVYYEVILSGDGNSVHGPVWSGLVWFSVIWFGQVCLCDVWIA